MKKILFSMAIVLIATCISSAQEPEKTGEVEKVKEAVEEVKEVEKAKEVVEQVKEEVVKEEAEPKKESTSAKTYIKDLSSNDENTVIQAADWLGKEKEKGAVSELMRLLKNDKRVKVRVFAAIALGLIGDEKSIETLNEALVNDRNSDVRYSVLLAIHRIDPSKSIDALKKAKESETDPYIRDYLEKMEAKVKGD